MQIVTIGFIRARRAKIDTEITRQREAIAASEQIIDALQARRADLDLTERVISEILIEEGILSADQTEASPPASLEILDDDSKPEGVPSVPEMITEAIRYVSKDSGKGIKPVMITAFIRARWWPTVSPEKVSPIAWRMWKRGQLIKDGNTYALPRQKRDGTNGVAHPAALAR
jgi:hypothetical protein